jgi:hypothetical protein
MRKNNRIGTRPITNDSYNLDVAYICIPQDVDRTSFVKRCLNNGVVAIKNEYGLFEKDAFISRNLLDVIEFPESPFVQGSCVLFTRLNNHSSPVIVAVLASKIELTGHDYENQFVSLRRGRNGSFSNVSGWGDSGVLKLSSSSVIDISSISSASENVINLYSSGDINMYSFRNTLNRYVSKFQIINSTADGEFTNLNIEKENIALQNSKNILKIEKDAGVSIKSDSVNIGNQSTLERSIKGESLVNQLDSVLDKFSSLLDNLVVFSTTQATAASAVPLTSGLAIAFTNLSSSVNLIKSEVLTIKAKLSEEVLSKEVKNS